MVRILPFLISLALSVYALFSCIQTRDEDVPHLPKLFWIVLIVLVPFVGPITWILMSRAHAHKQHVTGRSGHPSAGPRRPAPRQVAPDDDPEFLAWLAKNRPEAPGGAGKPSGKDDKPGKKDKPTGPADTSSGKSANPPGKSSSADTPKDADTPADRPDPDDGEAGDLSR
ncbi:PLD nuclease N-terminal domain-containing protein [Kribbella deserti]|uniref:PLD nuclease N-terminal domain-containing protein n=1 Tax=Kribbella deserti TaxID=1926257 RepID=A0ABV6QVW0_9ACTN